MKHNYLIIIILLLFSISGLKAQQAITSSGKDAASGTGSVSYSVGQTVYKTYTAGNGSVAQGVQQPYEISVVLSTEEAVAISLQPTAFPNPATNYVTLNLANYDLTNLSYQVIDINGRTLEQKKIFFNETTISLDRFPKSFFFLHLLDNNKEIKTFKIIKN